ncbi:uncharacterized protein LOC113656452 [Tachysurus fulvidraco]|uniref:uncharacterized protein LOC113656452 n=1 Tax=Tachysurus fulvidraco TaxID=1234273 RepID=UPI001FEED31E|nr:uncharacterized protein LOC113656452 [Tachysurus fulvidraco]
MFLHLDDKLLVSLKQLLQDCSHVELQPTSLIRIYFTGCYLQDWVGQNTQYTVREAFFNKTLEEVSSKSCPSATSGPRLQFPQLTCGISDVIVKLSANELKYVQIIAPDRPSLGERDTSLEHGLTQERTKDFLVITVNAPRMEDLAELLLEYTNVRNELYTAKLFCTQYHFKPRSNRKTDFWRFYRNRKLLQKRAITLQTTLLQPRAYSFGAVKRTQAANALKAKTTLAIPHSSGATAASHFLPQYLNQFIFKGQLMMHQHLQYLQQKVVQVVRYLQQKLNQEPNQRQLLQQVPQYLNQFIF